jgi:nitrogen fixation protein NifU and related proteins
MDMYREQLLDHYHHPRGWGLRAESTVQQHLVNASCGDAVTVQVDVADNHITAMRFEGHGCVISRAAASLLTEYLQNKTVTECLACGWSEVQTLLGTDIQPTRIKCALLSLEAVQQSLQPYAGN